MKEQRNTSEIPPYACAVVGTLDQYFTAEDIRAIRARCCPTCAYPTHNAGPRCPECETYHVAQGKLYAAAHAKALETFFDPRNIHVFGRGTVTPNDPDYHRYVE